MHSIFTQIAEIILGKKYYAVIINTSGTFNCQIASFIFANRKNAKAYCNDLLYNNASFKAVEIISFRSKNEYTCTDLFNK